MEDFGEYEIVRSNLDRRVGFPVPPLGAGGYPSALLAPGEDDDRGASDTFYDYMQRRQRQDDAVSQGSAAEFRRFLAFSAVGVVSTVLVSWLYARYKYLHCTGGMY